MIQYREGSLFDAPKGSLLVHACNAQGVWGSGIAREFKQRFPKSFEEYREFCLSNKKRAVGQAFVTAENVGCLITSYSYGGEVDEPLEILTNTKLALINLTTWQTPLKAYSNKFNSGLFNVPWPKTEAIIKEIQKCYAPEMEWVVMAPKV